jgi:hypothetical protein
MNKRIEIGIHVLGIVSAIQTLASTPQLSEQGSEGDFQHFLTRESYFPNFPPLYLVEYLYPVI